MIARLRARLRDPTGALREKQAVALSSVIAAVLLTVLKLGVGVSTGSLGILAEAAHSGLDLVAALTTWMAVRIADRDPDESHPYGHERFENLAALFETLLLLLTCAWIVWEAIDRLGSDVVHVEASPWAFLVMFLSIGVDWSRSRALHRAAVEHDSQALEADALHFSTDMWSSAAVIVGLGLVWIGGRVDDGGILTHADTIAALVVAAIVVWISVRLGLSTIHALVDRAPPGLAEDLVAMARQAPGVVGAKRARVRRAGNKTFIDLVVSVARTATFADAHAVADRVEEAVHARVPRADVVVHVEPVASPSETLTDEVHFVAQQRGVAVHDVRVRQVDGEFEVDLHVELDPHLSLADAHAVATELEQDLLATNDHLGAVNTHLEAPAPRISQDEDVTDESRELVRRVREIADRVAGVGAAHEVRVYRSRDLRNLVVHATFGAEMSIDRVHLLSAEIERALRAELDAVGTVLIHAEPPNE